MTSISDTVADRPIDRIRLPAHLGVAEVEEVEDAVGVQAQRASRERAWFALDQRLAVRLGLHRRCLGVWNRLLVW
jgi:hypothetical protein